jgi:hypothetical protein
MSEQFANRHVHIQVNNLIEQEKIENLDMVRETVRTLREILKEFDSRSAAVPIYRSVRSQGLRDSHTIRRLGIPILENTEDIANLFSEIESRFSLRFPNKKASDAVFGRILGVMFGYSPYDFVISDDLISKEIATFRLLVAFLDETLGKLPITLNGGTKFSDLFSKLEFGKIRIQLAVVFGCPSELVDFNQGIDDFVTAMCLHKVEVISEFRYYLTAHEIKEIERAKRRTPKSHFERWFYGD